MSVISKVACDGNKCGVESEEGYDGATIHALPENWGKVFDHDEHYCENCWDYYCEDNNVDMHTGKDL